MCPELEISSGSCSASWLPSLTAMEKNWHRRHTSGGCSPLVRLGKVGSSLETQSTLILVIVLVTMVWEHLSPGSSLSRPLDLWEPPLSGAHYFPSRNARMGIYAFMPQAAQGSGWGDTTHFPSAKDLLPLSHSQRTEPPEWSPLQAIFWPPRNTSVATQMTCQTPTLPASEPCFHPHHSLFGPSDWTLKSQEQASCFLDLILHPSAVLNYNYYQNYL